MSDIQEAKEIALEKFSRGYSTDDTIAYLSQRFEDYNFFTGPGALYMQRDDCSTPQVQIAKLLQIHSDLKVEIGLDDATAVLEYAANHIDNNIARGIFIKAYVEEAAWAIEQFKNYKRICNNG